VKGGLSDVLRAKGDSGVSLAHIAPFHSWNGGGFGLRRPASRSRWHSLQHGSRLDWSNARSGRLTIGSIWWTVSESRSHCRHFGSRFSIMSRIARHLRVPLGSRPDPKTSL